MVGFYLLLSGNKLSGVLASLWDTYDNKQDFFWVNFGLLMFATMLMFVLLKQLNKVMQEKEFTKNKNKFKQLKKFKTLKENIQNNFGIYSSVEMWERLFLQGMRGCDFFMVHQLFMKEDVAQFAHGATQAFVYAFTFVGGLFADKILGYRKSLFWGGL